MADLAGTGYLPHTLLASSTLMSICPNWQIEKSAQVIHELARSY